mmetsp:Transcript_7492/g.17965  ORF Transcript_7492/g.17965 Transcript_7492/m.17965 type:complete len:215 (+) Transcript_7492:724-1368(+)
MSMSGTLSAFRAASAFSRGAQRSSSCRISGGRGVASKEGHKKRVCVRFPRFPVCIPGRHPEHPSPAPFLCKWEGRKGKRASEPRGSPSLFRSFGGPHPQPPPPHLFQDTQPLRIGPNSFASPCASHAERRRLGALGPVSCWCDSPRFLRERTPRDLPHPLPTCPPFALLPPSPPLPWGTGSSSAPTRTSRAAAWSTVTCPLTLSCRATGPGSEG